MYDESITELKYHGCIFKNIPPPQPIPIPFIQSQKPTLVWRTADKTFYSILSLESSPSVPLWQYLPYHLQTVMGPFYWSCPHWQDTTIQWQESKIPWHKTLLLWQGTSPTSIHNPVNSDTCFERKLDNRDIAIKRRLDNRKILSMIELPILPLGNWIKKKVKLSFCLQIKDHLSIAVNNEVFLYRVRWAFIYTDTTKR